MKAFMSGGSQECSTQDEASFHSLARSDQYQPQAQQQFIKPAYNNFFVAAPEKPQWKITNFTAVTEQASF